MGKNNDDEDRVYYTEKILKFVEIVFAKEQSIDFAEFCSFNT